MNDGLGLHTWSAGHGFGVHGSVTQAPLWQASPVGQPKKLQLFWGWQVPALGPKRRNLARLARGAEAWAPAAVVALAHAFRHIAGRRALGRSGLLIDVSLGRAVPARIVHAAIDGLGRPADRDVPALRALRAGEFAARARPCALTSAGRHVDAAFLARTERRAGVGRRTVVDVAVTVVVETIAELWRRTHGAGAHHLAIDADEVALLALADVDAAFVAEVSARILRVGGAVEPVRRAARLVDLPVAIVVLLVADLGFGPRAADADVGAGPWPGLHTKAPASHSPLVRSPGYCVLS